MTKLHSTEPTSSQDRSGSLSSNQFSNPLILNLQSLVSNYQLPISNSPISNYHLLITILQNLLRRQHPRRAHDSAARMRAAGAEIISFERRAEICPLRRGAQEKDLMQQQLAVKNISARDARDAFDIFRRNDLHAHNTFANVWRILLDG